MLLGAKRQDHGNTSPEIYLIKMTHPNSKGTGNIVGCPPNFLLSSPPNLTWSYKKKSWPRVVEPGKEYMFAWYPFAFCYPFKQAEPSLQGRERLSTATLSCLKVCSEVTWGELKPADSVSKGLGERKKAPWEQKGRASLEEGKLEQYDMPCLKTYPIF